MNGKLSRDERKIYLLKTLETRDQSLFDLWASLRNVIQPILDDKQVYEPIAYTPHDYSHHCLDIYRILSDLMQNRGIDDALTDEELFLLATSVLLHDISMVFNPSLREIHSAESAQITYGNFPLKLINDNDLDKFSNTEDLIKYQYANFCDALQTIIEVHVKNPKYLQLIAWIILGHSDLKIKGKKIDMIKQIIDNESLRKMFNTDGEPYKIPLLSALLRLSDELDITNSRISGIAMFMQGINQDSMDHWRKLELFHSVKLHENKIVLYSDKDQIDSSRQQKTDIELIAQVYTKVNKELEELNNKVFKACKHIRWAITEVSVDIFEDYKHELRQACNKLSGQVTYYRLENNEDISRQISKWVIENDMYKSNHYKLASSLHARDWIDCYSLVSDSKILKYLSTAFVHLIDSKDSDNLYIVGVGLEGEVIAGEIGLALGVPFTYAIPGDKKTLFGKHEIDFEILKNKNIYILIGCIVTGNTVFEIIDYMQNRGVKKTDIKGILTIFLRNPIMCHFSNDQCNKDSCQYNNCILEKRKILHDEYGIIFLNEEFDIEICGKNIDQCIFYKNNKNKIHNLGGLIYENH